MSLRDISISLKRLPRVSNLIRVNIGAGEFFNFLCSESVIKIRRTGVGFSRTVLLNFRKKMKINGINDKSENILIILVIAPKITGEFSKTNITCENLL